MVNEISNFSVFIYTFAGFINFHDLCASLSSCFIPFFACFMIDFLPIEKSIFSPCSIPMTLYLNAAKFFDHAP